MLGKTFPLAPQQHQLKQEAEWETTRSKWIGNFVVFSREIFTKLLNSKCCSGNAFWPSALYSFWSSEIAQPQNWVAKKKKNPSAAFTASGAHYCTTRGRSHPAVWKSLCFLFKKSFLSIFAMCLTLKKTKLHSTSCQKLSQSQQPGQRKRVYRRRSHVNFYANCDILGIACNIR